MSGDAQQYDGTLWGYVDRGISWGYVDRSVSWGFDGVTWG